MFPGTRADIRQYLADRGYVLVYTVAGEEGDRHPRPLRFAEKQCIAAAELLQNCLT